MGERWIVSVEGCDVGREGEQGFTTTYARCDTLEGAKHDNCPAGHKEYDVHHQPRG